MTAPLTIEMFGPMRVFVGDAPLPALRSRKALWLLGLLILRSNRPVAREWVASTLWPDSDLSTALSNLRPVMSELRRALGDQGFRLASPDRVTIVLDLQGADVDVLAFDRAIAGGDPLYATELYKGVLMEGCLEEWVPQERDQREQSFYRATQSLADRAYEAGDYAFALTGYRKLIAIDPWRDSPRRNMMRALAKSGDINAALQGYRDYANTLRSEGGMAPDERTTALYMRLRAALVSTDRSDHEDGEGLRAPKVVGGLPHALTSLVGREDEQVEIIRLVAQRRLTTLVGPGGIGKTRLASEVALDLAKSFQDGVWLVSFENLENGSLVLDHLMAALEVTGSDTPRVQRLSEAIKSKKMLLLLDNCEHVRDDLAPIISKILAGSAFVKVLATSREALGILGEQVWMVPPLSIPETQHLPPNPTVLRKVLNGYESIQLFVDRAQLYRHDFELTNENASSVAQICIQLEGVPLALELAAGRIRSMTTPQIAERLGDHLSLLTSKGGDTERQRTLRATLEWSHGLLSDPEKKLFRHLSIFSGGWTLEAAEEICGESCERNEVADTHVGLVAKSLIHFDERGGRFRFLETVRQFARERLTESGEVEDLRANHLKWYLQLAAQAAPKLTGSEVEGWLFRLDAESANLRSAIDEGAVSSDVMELVGTLWRWWYLRGRYSEGRTYFERVLEHPAKGNPAALQQALYGGGCLAYTQGDHEIARRWLEESLAIAKSERLDEGFAKTLNVLGNVAIAQKRYVEAMDYYEKSLHMQQKLGMEAGVMLLHYNLGSLSLSLCDFKDAGRRFGEALELYRRAGDPWGSGMCLAGMGIVACYQGDFDQAVLWTEEAIKNYRALQDQGRIGTSTYILGWIALEREQFVLAQEIAERSIASLKSVAVSGDQAYSLGILGSVAFAQRDFNRAWSILNEAYQLAIEHRVEPIKYILLAYLGSTAFQKGDLDEAKRLWRASLRGHIDREDPFGAALSFDGMALAYCSEGEYERAALCLGSALALRNEMGFCALQRFAALNDDTERNCRSALGDAAFATLVEGVREKRWTEAAEDALFNRTRTQAGISTVI